MVLYICEVLTNNASGIMNIVSTVFASIIGFAKQSMENISGLII